MGTMVSINGRFHAEAEAKVSVFDRGFLYGDSVFEVMRTYGGKPFAERAHLERLARSCERVVIEMPVSLETLSKEIEQTLRSAGNSESYIRVVVTRGSGPLSYDPLTASDPLRLVIVLQLPSIPTEYYEKGVGVALLRVARPTDDSRAAGAKASNYLSNLLAVHRAHESGAYEAIVLSPLGEVLEGASSNIFVVDHGKLRTPPVEAGILAGVTRSVVIEAAKTLRLPLTESVIFPNDLYAADEVFITSTLREIVPVVRVDNQTIGAGKPGPVTRQLHRAYLDAVRHQMAKG